MSSTNEPTPPSPGELNAGEPGQPAPDPAGDNPLVRLYTQTREEVGKVVYGQDDAVQLCLSALFSNGHILLEGVPGVAKTTLVRSVAETLSMSFSRIQFTPDLLPNDITGSHLYREDLHQFEFNEGPVFANFVLADEINRAPAKTQSALLEAMQEATVTQNRETRELPRPFTVFATQNPVEHDGTYPLPLAQLDRFMYKVYLDYPGAEAEERMLHEHHAVKTPGDVSQFALSRLATPEDILNARETIRQTYVRDEVVTYVRRLVEATRDDTNLMVGASPRGGLAMLMGAKSYARFLGRDFVTPDDIKSVYLPALRHRVMLAPTAELEGMSADEALRTTMGRVEVPR